MARLPFGYMTELPGIETSVMAYDILISNWWHIDCYFNRLQLQGRQTMYSYMKLIHINTGNFKLDGGAMFGVVPKSIWNKINPSDENNICDWALRCLLIEDESRLILVDNGIGDKQDEKFFSFYYLHGDDTLDKSLTKHGFSKTDITDVFLTHLHFDHCGGSIIREGEKLIPAFNNATYWSNKTHWDWAVRPNEREKASFLKENILPIEESGQLKFIEPWLDKKADTPGWDSNIMDYCLLCHSPRISLFDLLAVIHKQ